MTYRQIETSREIRLWVTNFVIPAAMAYITIESNPYLKATMKQKVNGVKSKMDSMIKRVKN